ncbi:pitrilysin family protein [Moorena sp. SIO3H5]|uniref:M16 family metallopeptidase n=1 Tax=Moorena sp. SIO3H5 TaxID=2607834 RepID=UPI0013BA5B75|nr:pitrilysin family protein [Moorena sp. SIO3H5]NEO69622.1 insulinase family protein [Moorena sp. SIO3H5]
MRLEALLSEPLPQVKFPASVFKLTNGLNVIHQYLSATPVVVADVWVGAGAIAEPEEWYGMAHFLEHMIFKGTETIAPGVFDYVIESHGGVTNAATSHDFAHFFVTSASEYLKHTLPPLAELLLHPAIPEEEFVRERCVVLEEIRGSYDNPDWVGFQALSESVYQRHPYGRPILGTEADLMAHSPQQMRCFHQCHYQPENMTVVIVGDIDQESALTIVNQSFQDFASPSDCPKPEVMAEAPFIGIRRQELNLPRLEHARLLMAWHGPGIDELGDACGLDLLSVLLADGRSSRLVRELREEKQLVQDIGSSFSLQRDSSLFTITAYLEPEYLEQVEAIIREHLWQLQQTPVSTTELKRCQRQLYNDYIFSTESAGQLAGLYGYYSTIATAQAAYNYPIEIQKLTANDVMQLAQRYLSPHRYAITILNSID